MNGISMERMTQVFISDDKARERINKLLEMPKEAWGSVSGNYSGSEIQEQLDTTARQIGPDYNYEGISELTADDRLNNHIIGSSRQAIANNLSARIYLSLVDILPDFLPAYFEHNGLFEKNPICVVNRSYLFIADRANNPDLMRCIHKMTCVAFQALYSLTIMSLITSCSGLFAAAMVTAAAFASAAFIVATFKESEFEEIECKEESAAPVETVEIPSGDEEGGILRHLPEDVKRAVNEVKEDVRRGASAIYEVKESSGYLGAVRYVLQSNQLHAVVVGIFITAIAYPASLLLMSAYVAYNIYYVIPRDVLLGIGEVIGNFKTPEIEIESEGF